MTAVYIITGIILLLFLLLIIPVKVWLDFTDGIFSLKIYYGLIKVYNSNAPKKEKTLEEKKEENKERKKTAAKKGKKSKISQLFDIKKEQLGIMGATKYFLDVLKGVLEKIIWLIKKIRFERFKLNLVVASFDAATTAINYGYFCTAIYPILSILSINSNLELKQVNISADFNKTAMDFDVSFGLRTRLIYFVIIAIKLLFEYKKLIKEVKENE